MPCRLLVIGAFILLATTSGRAESTGGCRQTRKLAARSAPLCLTRLAGLDTWLAPGDGTGDEPGAPGGRQSVLVMLHGYGQGRPALLKQVRTFARRHRSTLVFPEAPIRLASGGQAWWPAPEGLFRRGPARDEQPVPEGMELATEKLDALLDALATRLGISPEQIVVAGYSQGATLAVSVALSRARRGADRLGGVVSLSGRFVATYPWRADLAALGETPMLFAHGQRDHLSPYWATEALQQTLRDAGAAVAWMPHQGGHRPTAAVARMFHTGLESALSRAN